MDRVIRDNWPQRRDSHAETSSSRQRGAEADEQAWTCPANARAFMQLADMRAEVHWAVPRHHGRRQSPLDPGADAQAQQFPRCRPPQVTRYSVVRPASSRLPDQLDTRHRQAADTLVNPDAVQPSSCAGERSHLRNQQSLANRPGTTTRGASRPSYALTWAASPRQVRSRERTPGCWSLGRRIAVATQIVERNGRSARG